MDNSPTPLKHRQRGFTLLEVIVAVAILGTALAVLLTSVNRSLDLGFRSKALVKATALAQMKLAEVELNGLPEPGETKGVFENEPAYRWHQTVEPFSVPGLGTEIRVITLIINWGDENENLKVSFAISALQ